MTIIFYDFPSKVGPYNSHTWKVRYTLNYKGLAYKTIWTEHLDIEKMSKERGIAPTGVNFENGAPLYTLPAIYDESTGIGLSESHRIAEYLDKTYPDTPKVIPPGTESLQAAFITSYTPHFKALTQFNLPATLEAMKESESKEHFYKTRSKRFGRDLKTMRPTGAALAPALNDLRDGLNKVDEWLVKSDGLYVMGNTISFGDFALLSWLKWARVVLGNDSEEWKQISSWNEGRWGERVERLEKYGQAE
ncbi:hypothetical protein AX15_000784 [Amanita polypyramis BW_CC]|nr:hypothetical protein AX15_000784 [Amanita polypyramis BW_CC]